MKVIYYLINYLILGWFLFVISYYRDLYNSKEIYNREEVFSYPSIIKNQFQSLFGGMPWTLGMIIFVIVSLLGAWMPLWGNLFGNKYDNWFFDSAAPFLILYFIIPSIFALEINHHKNIQSHDDDNAPYPIEKKSTIESLKHLFQDHYDLLATGFGLGYTSYLTFNWGTYGSHPFFWNIANGFIIFWFSLQSMQNPERFIVSNETTSPNDNKISSSKEETKKEKKSSDKKKDS